MKKTSLKAALALLALGALVTAKASAYTEADSEITTSLPTIDGNDLILGTAPTSDTTEHGTPGSGYDATGAPNSVLTNGQLGALGSYTDGQEYYVTDLTDTSPQTYYEPSITYSLGSSPLGYDVNEVQTITQWGNNGRVDQDYVVSFSFDDGLTYGTTAGVNSFAVDYAPTSANVGLNVALTGLDVVGATNVEFTFVSEENNAVGYSELATDGTAVLAAPEPNSAALLLSSMVGGIALLVRRKMANA